MCGRYALEADIDILIDRYKAMISNTNPSKKSEIFPTETVPVIRDNGHIQIDMLKWGFAPSFAKKPLINARGETVDIKPTFKNSFISRRCIIPATSFFEWEKVGQKKIKRRIYIKEDEIFSIAGLYDTFYDKEGNPYEAFTILTTAANESMKHIHERMPVILNRETEGIWLNRDNKNVPGLKSLLLPWKSEMVIE